MQHKIDEADVRGVSDSVKDTANDAKGAISNATNRTLGNRSVPSMPPSSSAKVKGEVNATKRPIPPSPAVESMPSLNDVVVPEPKVVSESKVEPTIIQKDLRKRPEPEF